MNITELKETLVRIHKTTTNVDRYGQMSKSALSVGRVCADPTEVESLAKAHPNVIRVEAYAAYGGTPYKAVTIVDPDLRTQCSAALRDNPTYRSMMRGW